MKKSLPLYILTVVAVLLVSISSSSCYKDPVYRARVIVEDTTGERLENAIVRLYAPVPQTEIDIIDTTDENGRVDFTFGLDAVLEIEAYFGNLSGDGFLQLVEDELVTETIIVRP